MVFFKTLFGPKFAIFMRQEFECLVVAQVVKDGYTLDNGSAPRNMNDVLKIYFSTRFVNLFKANKTKVFELSWSWFRKWTLSAHNDWVERSVYKYFEQENVWAVLDTSRNEAVGVGQRVSTFLKISLKKATSTTLNKLRKREMAAFGGSLFLTPLVTQNDPRHDDPEWGIITMDRSVLTGTRRNGEFWVRYGNSNSNRLVPPLTNWQGVILEHAVNVASQSTSDGQVISEDHFIEEVRNAFRGKFYEYIIIMHISKHVFSHIPISSKLVLFFEIHQNTHRIHHLLSSSHKHLLMA